eukprot:127163-Prymnesium_polylepis.1
MRTLVATPQAAAARLDASGRAQLRRRAAVASCCPRSRWAQRGLAAAATRSPPAVPSSMTGGSRRMAA